MRFTNIARLASNNTIGSMIENNMLKQGGFITVAQAKKLYDALSQGQSTNTTTNVKNSLRRFAEPLCFITNENNRQTALYIHKGLNPFFRAQNSTVVPILRFNRLLNQGLFGVTNTENDFQPRRPTTRNIKKTFRKLDNNGSQR
jgi:hypothetical protein